MSIRSRTGISLPVIVFAQFAGTSLWFVGNAILPELQPLLQAPELTSWITSAVQIGFITGTLLYAILGIPDRFRSTYIFFVSVLLAATANIGWLFFSVRAESVLVSRFLTGFFLAGVYPVGMKIAADRFKTGLGQAMGFLVGALVLGTAFPHLVRGVGGQLPYRTLLLLVSLLAIGGGVLLTALVPATDPPLRARKFRVQALLTLWKPSPFRPAMLGYFGHMWELYTLWSFLPLLITYVRKQHPVGGLTDPLWAFGAIAAGALGCVGGGYWSSRIGSTRIARYLLTTSGLCILLTPLLIGSPPLVFGLFLVIWGAAAAGDSPQFSTLVARHAPLEDRGSILTLVTCFGFLLTVVSIQLMGWLIARTGISGWLFYGLLPGPLAGILALRRAGRNDG